MCKVGGVFDKVPAADLGAFVVKEVVARTDVPTERIDELIFGNVAQPSDTQNIARVIALKAGLPTDMPAFTVHRNCGSGSEALTTAASKIRAGEGEVFIVGGTESMSNIPLLFNKKMQTFFGHLAGARSIGRKLKTCLSFRPEFLKPVIGLVDGLTDPVCGMIMGKTAEVLAREFHIGREEQDEFALRSHQKAVAAMERGVLVKEIVPTPVPPDFKHIQMQDDGPRADQSLEALAKLRPYFDRVNGTVTVGNACPLTDAAAAMLVMREEKAKEFGYEPLGYLRAAAYTALEPHRMGLGPVYSTAKVLDKSGLSMKDIDLIELNEAFAVQVIANERAFASDEFARRYLGRDARVGEIDPEILNVNGGAVALGHPVGTTGARLIITVLRELRRRGKSIGLATMCIGGGQGGALLLEAA